MKLRLLKLRRPCLAGLCAFAIVGAAAPASAQIILGGEPVATPGVPAIAPTPLTVDLDAVATTPDFKPVVFAVPDFAGATPEEIELGKTIAGIIRADLSGTGVFASADAAAYAQIASDIATLPGWAAWEGAATQALVVGKVEINASGLRNIQFRLYDIATHAQLLGRQYAVPSTGAVDRIAHKIADDFYEQITGAGRYFDSRITYAAEIGGKTQLGFVDQDGRNADKLTQGVARLRAPRFSPQSRQVVYSAEAPVPGSSSKAQLTTILYDLETGRREALFPSAQPQPNPDARFSADGRSVIYSRKIGGNDEIALFSLAQGKETVLNASPASDTAPSLSPDGHQYVFVSDRDGSQQLYVSRVDGADVTCAAGAAKACRISAGSGAYANPVWSPAGNAIAFEHTAGAATAIGVVQPDGANEKAVTSGAKDKSPAWSPNGRAIAFARETSGGSKLWMVDRSGRGLREVPTPGEAREPHWGPVLD